MLSTDDCVVVANDLWCVALPPSVPPDIPEPVRATVSVSRATRITGSIDDVDEDCGLRGLRGYSSGRDVGRRGSTSASAAAAAVREEDRRRAGSSKTSDGTSKSSKLTDVSALDVIPEGRLRLRDSGSSNRSPSSAISDSSRNPPAPDSSSSVSESLSSCVSSSTTD